jgi:hypothetical protein
MTKRDFTAKVPDIIHHKTWGYAELEIIVDKEGQKGVCYRHKDKTTSCGTYGITWKEVYTKLNKHLISEGYKN